MKQTTKLLLTAIIVTFCIPSSAQQKERIFPILGSQIKASKNMTAPGNEKGQTIKFEIKERGFVPFTQSCVHQTSDHRGTTSGQSTSLHFVGLFHRTSVA
jgi:hypothetical protein